MAFSRLMSWTLLIALGFGLLKQAVSAQDQQLPRKNSIAVEAVNTYREASTRGIPAADLPEAKKHFLAFANYYGEMLKYPLLYKAAQDPSVKDPTGRTIPPLEGINGVFTDLQRFIVEPIPKNAANVNKDRGDYIRELGNAFDMVLKPIINENPEKIVQINATRMLATVCKTGATAFYPTVTALLKNGNTPPYIKHYALAAAGNLLSAYDVYGYASRRHSNGWKNDQTKGAGDKELAELVIEIEKHVVDPKAILSNYNPAETTTDQQDVIRFIRREAIRALAQVRFVAIPAPDGKSMLYPAYTLSRICISDPALAIAPNASECVEAALGLCNMSPIRDGDIQKDYDRETAVEAVTAGLVTFAERRAADDKDKSLDWRGYGLKLGEAFKTWPKLFDFGFNPLQPNNFNGTIPPPVEGFVQRMQISLITPLEKGESRVAIEDMKGYLKSLRARQNPKPLFASNAATSLHPQMKK